MATQGQNYTKVFGAVNIGSFAISAMIAGVTEGGELRVLGSSYRQAQGVKRGYITDMAAATIAVRLAIEKAEKFGEVSVQSVWLGCSGAGLSSRIAEFEIDVGGRRVEDEDIETLLISARDGLQPDGRHVLHAQPAFYTLDGAHGVTNPKGLHAERLGVHVHVTMVDGAPIRNVKETVQNAHLDVEAVVAAPLAAALACLTDEERDLGVALVEFGGEITSVSVYSGGTLVGLTTIPFGSADITDAIASSFGIRRFQAERLKCVHGSAIASPSDHRELVPVAPSDDETAAPLARGADDKNRIPRAELISIITGQLDRLIGEVSNALKAMGFAGDRGQQVVFTGGGSELAGLADYAQAALGKPVRIGRPPQLRGLPDAHTVPGFSTLAGLVLYAAADPVDIRSIGPSYSPNGRYKGTALLRRLLQVAKEYF